MSPIAFSLNSSKIKLQLWKVKKEKHKTLKNKYKESIKISSPWDSNSKKLKTKLDKIQNWSRKSISQNCSKRTTNSDHKWIRKWMISPSRWKRKLEPTNSLPLNRPWSTNLISSWQKTRKAKLRRTKPNKHSSSLKKEYFFFYSDRINLVVHQSTVSLRW